jgi:hypothetical protein
MASNIFILQNTEAWTIPVIPFRIERQGWCPPCCSCTKVKGFRRFAIEWSDAAAESAPAASLHPSACLKSRKGFTIYDRIKACHRV